ncbi:hypothetical protein BS50DRAFT_390594 [Corynespora cassiicola Philippines]|uniref:Uncharacterized protein n=1 Tax=Corynespora cassiicola Philippines TaxID=1448308 RepID=A0A2T2NPL8_CORCC|nr:hypothetical protein BS50DRAFT_390594 [Corynespora cassiicola Philippines]
MNFRWLQNHVPSVHSSIANPTPASGYASIRPTLRQATVSEHQNARTSTSDANLNTTVTSLNGTRKRPSVSAKIVFKDSEDMNKFLYWLRKRKNMANVTLETAPFPTATEYNEFIGWMSPKSDSVRHPCNHLRHPWDKINPIHCPVCTVEMHINLVELIFSRMQEAQGSKKLQDQLLAGWRFTKSSLANHLINVEKLAEKEKEWERTNADINTKDAYSHAHALAVAGKASDRHLAELHVTSTELVPKKVDTSQSDISVSFASNLAMPSAETSRPSQLYCRNSQTYVPGRYACPSKDGWHDSSLMDSLYTSITQCQLFLIDTPSDVPISGTHQMKSLGLVTDYKYQDKLLAHLRDLSRHCNKSKKELLWTMMHSSDSIAVSKPRSFSIGREVVVKFSDVRLFVRQDTSDDIGITRKESEMAADGLQHQITHVLRNPSIELKAKREEYIRRGFMKRWRDVENKSLPIWR